jgi:tRNA-dihydrouridine synthase 3
VLEVLPPKINHRNPGFVPRDDLEGLLAGDQVTAPSLPTFYLHACLERRILTTWSSMQVTDWMKISEMFLGPCPEGFKFKPKHRSSEKMSADDSAQAEG